MFLTDSEKLAGAVGVQQALRATLATRDGQISRLQQERDALRKQLDAAQGELAALNALKLAPSGALADDARRSATEARRACERRLGDAWQGAGNGHHGA